MKAMILAAGKGERMQPLTFETPKPLLSVGRDVKRGEAGETLISRHLLSLSEAGFTEVVINLHHLKEKIQAHVGDGSQFGLRVSYSDETELLETAGGIQHALALLGDQPFLVVNGDIYTDFDFSSLARYKLNSAAHLLMVPNPPHHPFGDFGLDDTGILRLEPPHVTYAGIGVYSPTMFAGLSKGKSTLRLLFDKLIPRGEISGQIHRGLWKDIGTLERYEDLKRLIEKSSSV